MQALLKETFADQGDTPSGHGAGWTIGQHVLYPAKDDIPQGQEISNAVQMALRIAREQAKNAYEKSHHNGNKYDLNVRLSFMDAHGSSEIILNCTHSEDQAIRSLRSHYTTEHGLFFS